MKTISTRLPLLLLFFTFASLLYSQSGQSCDSARTITIPVPGPIELGVGVSLPAAL